MSDRRSTIITDGAEVIPGNPTPAGRRGVRGGAKSRAAGAVAGGETNRRKLVAFEPWEPKVRPSRLGHRPNPAIRNYRLRVLATDIVIVTAAAVLASLSRFGLDDNDRLAASVSAFALSYQSVTVLTVIAWILWLWIQGCWAIGLPGDGSSEFRRIVRASVSLFAVVVTIDYLLDLKLARGFLLVVVPIGLAGIIAARLCWRRWLGRRRSRGLDRVDMLVVGGRISATVLAEQLRRETDCGYEVAGLCIPGGDPTGQRTGGAPDGKPATLGGFAVLGISTTWSAPSI